MNVFKLFPIVDKNPYFLRVLDTEEYLQLTTMNIVKEIGWERHMNDQFFFVMSGEGKIVVDDFEYDIYPGDGGIIPSGKEHNIFNSGGENYPLKIFNIYGPPKHKPDEIIAVNTKTY